MVRIYHAGHTVEVATDGWQVACDAIIAAYGPWVPGESRVEFLPDAPAVGLPFSSTDPLANAIAAGAVGRPSLNAADFKPVDLTAFWACVAHVGRETRSEWGVGAQVTDSTGQARAEDISARLASHGVHLDHSQQLYATGTRLAQVGVDTQNARAQEHNEMEPARAAADRFVNRIKAEKRFGRVLTGAEIASKMSMNGALRVDGYKLRPHAVRGMLGRAQSPALTYVLGLRDRIAYAVRLAQESKTDPTIVDPAVLRRLLAQADRDKIHMLDTMRLELDKAGTTEFQLRCREGMGDIFATVSPSYGEADAPAVMPDILASLPDDCRASVSYDPASTRWEFRAQVYTPTPSDLQVVGEAFRAYTSFQSADGGNGSLDSGGGLDFLGCLNALTLTAACAEASRRHRSRILYNLPDMIRESVKSIHTLIAVWGEARQDVIEAPALVPLEQVVPGFFRAMLTARKGELVGVLPGRTEKHVQALAQVYPGERRDTDRLVRADLANAYTKYIQGQDGTTRRAAEAAIGSWVVNRPVLEWAKA